MRWGYNWTVGPFELWDAIGVRSIVDRLQKQGRAVPELTIELLDSGAESFYGTGPDEQPTVYDRAAGRHVSAAPPS